MFSAMSFVGEWQSVTKTTLDLSFSTTATLPRVPSTTTTSPSPSSTSSWMLSVAATVETPWERVREGTQKIFKLD